MLEEDAQAGGDRPLGELQFADVGLAQDDIARHRENPRAVGNPAGRQDAPQGQPAGHGVDQPLPQMPSGEPPPITSQSSRPSLSTVTCAMAPFAARMP